MARPVVTDLTPEQRRRLAAELRAERARIVALQQPAARASARFGSFADTASEALLAMRKTCAEGGSLLQETLELSVCLFLTATANAEAAYQREGALMPADAQRRLQTYRTEYRQLIASQRFLALPA